MHNRQRNSAVHVLSHEGRQPLTISPDLLSRQQGGIPAKTFNSAPMSVSPRKATKLVTSPQRLEEQTVTSSPCKSPRKSPGNSLAKFLSSTSDRSIERVKSTHGVCGLPAFQKSPVTTVCRSTQKHASPRKRQDPPAVLACEPVASSPRRSPMQGRMGKGNADVTSTEDKFTSPCQPMQEIGVRYFHGATEDADTSPVSCPRRPERSLNKELPVSTFLPDSPAEHAVNPILPNHQYSGDCIPTKPTRSPSKGSKTQNAVFRPKTPQKRSIKKGIKISPTSLMACISSPAARMKALASSSSKAALNLFVGIVSPASVDSETRSSDKFNNKISLDKMKAPDLTQSASKEDNNDSNSSLKISDLSDRPTRVMQMSLPDLLGRSIQHTTSNDESLSDLFDWADGENETIFTQDTRTPLCEDRWHCSTPCLPSSSTAFLANQPSMRRLQLSPTNNDSIDSQRNSSSSEFFMPNKPRRYKSRECS